ncbi:MAG: type II toxin-antitoxin system VapC family toxin [Herpetosiphonaceae bacterium]|nr:type II toxin-antitoxin system VapC family toxin [Herpetosiphonaceae bacterium]
MADITRVEVAAALAARQRAGTGLTLGERDALVRLLARHATPEYHAMSGTLIDRAMDLRQCHRLRGYDAVQLASALTTNMLLPALTFVAADDDLITAARAEGILVENPNVHP